MKNNNKSKIKKWKCQLIWHRTPDFVGQEKILYALSPQEALSKECFKFEFDWIEPGTYNITMTDKYLKFEIEDNIIYFYSGYNEKDKKVFCKYEVTSLEE